MTSSYRLYPVNTPVNTVLAINCSAVKVKVLRPKILKLLLWQQLSEDNKYHVNAHKMKVILLGLADAEDLDNIYMALKKCKYLNLQGVAMAIIVRRYHPKAKTH